MAFAGNCDLEPALCGVRLMDYCIALAATNVKTFKSWLDEHDQTLHANIIACDRIMLRVIKSNDTQLLQTFRTWVTRKDSIAMTPWIDRPGTVANIFCEYYALINIRAALRSESIASALYLSKVTIAALNTYRGPDNTEFRSLCGEMKTVPQMKSTFNLFLELGQQAKANRVSILALPSIIQSPASDNGTECAASRSFVNSRLFDKNVFRLIGAFFA